MYILSAFSPCRLHEANHNWVKGKLYVYIGYDYGTRWCKNVTLLINIDCSVLYSVQCTQYTYSRGSYVSHGAQKL